MNELEQYKAERRAKKAAYMREYFKKNKEARKRQNERNLNNYYKKKNEILDNHKTKEWEGEENTL